MAGARGPQQRLTDGSSRELRRHPVGVAVAGCRAVADLVDHVVSNGAVEGRADAQVVLPAEGAQHIRVIDVDQRGFERRTEGHATVLVILDVGVAGREGNDPARRSVERTLGAEVQVAGDRVTVHIRRRGLDHLQRGDATGAHLAEVDVAQAHRGAARHRNLVAVHQQGGEVLGHSAHVDGIDFAARAIDRDAGEAHNQLADRRARVAEGIDRRDCLHVRRGPLFVDRRGLALADRFHDELVHLVERGGQRDVAAYLLARLQLDAEALFIQAGVADDDGLRPFGQHEAVHSVVVRGLHHQRARGAHESTGQDVTGVLVDDLPGDNAGAGGGLGGQRAGKEGAE